MGLVIVLVLVALVLVLLAFPLGKSAHVENLLGEIDRTDGQEELAEAEDEVKDLDALATPEDASRELPDWGPGAPRKRRQS